MQMGSADPPGGAAQTDLITSGNALAGLHINFTQMRVVGENALAMIHDDNVAGIKQIFGQSDGSEIGGKDGCAHLGTEISAAVIALQLTVKQPLGTKDTGDITVQRLDKMAKPQARVVAAGINASNLFFFRL